MKLRGLGRADFAWIGEMEEFVAEMPAFDADGLAGFSFAGRTWPHGWTGAGKPHGAVFSR